MSAEADRYGVRFERWAPHAPGMWVVYDRQTQQRVNTWHNQECARRHAYNRSHPEHRGMRFPTWPLELELAEAES
jgi:hypothetical protein